jgi:2-polyprenyl-3-methyl-5-hydroxy-6-metoxy-1,4-benzoquinol methylase
MKEEEIRPQKLFDELLRLNKEDIKKYFDDSLYTNISCPACKEQGEFVFNKGGFNFDECQSCKTLYVSPRPNKESFDAYYTDSQSTKFWATEFYKATQATRREKLWKPKAELINDKIKKYANSTECVIDIGGGYGIFMEEFLLLNKLEHLIIEPSQYLSEVCREKKLNVLEKFLEDIKCGDLTEKRKTFVSFELFEHLHDPNSFLKTLYHLMLKGDTFIFTTLSGMGVDIQSLWKDSKSISPPMHLNFFNPKSVKLLLETCGYRVLEVTTPGKLDIDIMNNNKEKIKDRFWKNFLDYSFDDEKDKMQTFLSKNKLSSHMMIVCQKV